jgi:D-alanyl-D-alanine carboxypeptidase/D-alanyl-D-alanine-endopeptidase (penicillin-binding protein 4)
MKIRILMVLFAVLMGQNLLSQQNFDIAFKNFLAQPEYKNATTALCISDLTLGETLYSFNSEKLMIPASTMKLVTSAAALELLGTGYRFTTKIGYSGKIKDGNLDGDLVIVGGGDPTLGSEYFRSNFQSSDFMDIWIQNIKNAGIKNIRGNLILDVSLYDDEKIPPTWIWEDMGNYYGAGASALTVYDNLFRITFSSSAIAGKPTQIVSTYPKIEDLEIENEVLSSDENRDLAYVFGSPLDNRRIIRGTIPKNRKAFTIKASVQHPQKLLADDFIFHLAKAGIFISGGVRFERVYAKQIHAIYIQESPELSEIVKVLNYESVNLFAEHLIKQIAAEKTGQGSREKGIKIVQEFWKSKGVAHDFFMEDGSGLSHFNAISPAYFISLLKTMSESNNAEVFLNSLPGAANLSGFDSKMFTPDGLKAKSGSMTRVRCYAGYLLTDSGKKLAFAFMVNHFSGSHSKLIDETEKLLTIVKSSF